MFFVIGSRNSSNSVRLVEVAKKSGCLKSHLIHSQSEIPYDLIENSSTIGISLELLPQKFWLKILLRN